LLLFNNIFWDNRAGTRSGGTVTGIGAAGDVTAINTWDIGVTSGNASDVLAPTNSIIAQNAGTHPYMTSGSNSSANPAVGAAYDTVLAFAPWRTNPNFVGAILVAADLPPGLLGDYHLSGTGSPAFNLGAANKPVPTDQQAPAGATPLNAPAFDIDNQARPALGGFDSGADEFPGAITDLSISKDDGLTSVTPGTIVHYTITVANAGPASALLAPVNDAVPAALTGVTWACVATAGSSCGAASGSGNINTTVSLTAAGSATFTLNGTVAANATGTLANTATVTAPAGTTDPTPGNNSATDSEPIIPARPTLTVLDNFNRANANTLNNGANWSQIVLFGQASIRVNSSQAYAALAGWAIWNAPTAGFGAKQGAAFTFASTPATGSFLVLKGTGGTANTPASFARVFYSSTAGITVATTTNSGGTYTTRATFPATFATGDTLTALADATGNVFVWKTTGAAVTTFVGSVAIPTSGTGAWTQGTGGGRIGVMLPTNARVDNFAGGTVTP